MAYFEAFRRLDYPASAIFFAVSGTPPTVQMTLKHGGKEFTCNVERLHEGDKREIARGWKTACASWKVADDSERQVLWRRSFVRRNAIDFVVAMVSRGFRVDPAALTADS